MKVSEHLEESEKYVEKTYWSVNYLLFTLDSQHPCYKIDVATKDIALYTCTRLPADIGPFAKEK